MIDKLEETFKTCRECGEEKPLHLFGSNVSSKDSKSCYCKKCRCARESKRKVEDPEGFNEEKRKHYLKYKEGYRHRQLNRHFGIGIDEYNLMYVSQGGLCKCCGVHQSEIKLGLAVDHCHTTKKIRGLLCGSCNTAIGLVKENKYTLSTMIRYLEENS